LRGEVPFQQQPIEEYLGFVSFSPGFRRFLGSFSPTSHFLLLWYAVLLRHT